jgi:hypothetical protein
MCALANKDSRHADVEEEKQKKKKKKKKMMRTGNQKCFVPAYGLVDGQPCATVDWWKLCTARQDCRLHPCTISGTQLMRFSFALFTGKFPLSNDPIAGIGDCNGSCGNDTHPLGRSSRRRADWRVRMKIRTLRAIVSCSEMVANVHCSPQRTCFGRFSGDVEMSQTLTTAILGLHIVWPWRGWQGH